MSIDYIKASAKAKGQWDCHIWGVEGSAFHTKRPIPVGGGPYPPAIDMVVTGKGTGEVGQQTNNK